MPESRKLVSVVMPTFNSEKFIEASARSVLEQSHTELELIIVDDYSSDSTLNMLKSIMENDSRVRLTKLTENSGGPAKPRNVGLQASCGNYVAFIDADDVWHEDKLTIQLREMRANNYDFTSTKLIPFQHLSQIGGREPLESSEHQLVTLDQLLRKNIHANSSVMMSAEMVKYLSFSEESKYSAVEDYLAWINLHKLDRFRSARLGYKLVYYRLHSESISHRKWVMARKIYGLLSDIEINGRRLGLKRYFYFTTYLLGAMKSKMYV